MDYSTTNSQVTNRLLEVRRYTQGDHSVDEPCAPLIEKVASQLLLTSQRNFLLNEFCVCNACTWQFYNLCLVGSLIHQDVHSFHDPRTVSCTRARILRSGNFQGYYYRNGGFLRHKDRAVTCCGIYKNISKDLSDCEATCNFSI